MLLHKVTELWHVLQQSNLKEIVYMVNLLHQGGVMLVR